MAGVIANGERIPSATVLWTAGVAPSPVGWRVWLEISPRWRGASPGSGERSVCCDGTASLPISQPVPKSGSTSGEHGAALADLHKIQINATFPQAHIGSADWGQARYPTVASCRDPRAI